VSINNKTRNKQYTDYADKVKANLPEPKKRRITSKTKNVKVFPLKDNEMTINQQLQLIREKN